MKKIFLAIAGTLIFAAASLHFMTAWHENRHAQIFKDKNCTDINITYEYFDFDNTLATTSAYCFGDQGGEKHEKLHETQEKLWYLWMAAVLFFEFSFIQFLTQY